MKRKVVMLPIASIRNTFDVRKQLSDDNILRLGELYEAGVELPPVEVTDAGGGFYDFVDGRHRVAARVLLNLADVPAVIIGSSPSKRDDVIELYSKALEANYGGALAPTKADIAYTIQRLIEQGCKQRDIVKALHFIPGKVIENYMRDVMSGITKRNIQSALDAVAGGASIADAAALWSLKEDQVKEAISGKRRKWGAGGEGSVLAEYKAYIARVLKSANLGIAKKVLVLINQVDGGELSQDTAYKVIDFWDKTNNATMHRIKDWHERLAQTARGSKPQEEEDV